MTGSDAGFKARYGPLWHLRTRHDQVDGRGLSMTSLLLLLPGGELDVHGATKRRWDIHSGSLKVGLLHWQVSETGPL